MKDVWAVCRLTRVDGGAPCEYILVQFDNEKAAKEICRFLNELYDRRVFDVPNAEYDLIKDFETSGFKFGYDEGGTGEFFIRKLAVASSYNNIKKEIKESLEEYMSEAVDSPILISVEADFVVDGCVKRTIDVKISGIIIDKKNVGFEDQNIQCGGYYGLRSDEFRVTLTNPNKKITRSVIRTGEITKVIYISTMYSITQMFNVKFRFSDGTTYYLTRDRGVKILLEKG